MPSEHDYLDAIKKENVLRRFWKHVDRPDEVGKCWLWKSSRISQGRLYANEFVLMKKDFTARRISWAIHFGELPSFDVWSTCGNVLCVNPAHLTKKHDQRPRDGAYHGVKYATREEARQAELEQKRLSNQRARDRKRAALQISGAEVKRGRPKVVKAKAVKVAPKPIPVIPKVVVPKSKITRVKELAKLVGFNLKHIGSGQYLVQRAVQ